MGGRMRMVLGAVVAAVAGSVVTPAPAGAAATTVSCASGQTGLVTAIQNANAIVGLDTVVLEAGCTYALAGRVSPGANGLPQITSSVTIQGNGASIVRTSGMDLRIFEVVAGGSLTIDRLVMSGGSVTTHGGGILNNEGGTLTVTNSVISGNHVRGALGPPGQLLGFGGGLANFGTARLTNVLVRDNSVTSVSAQNLVIAGGGGIWTQVGSLTLDSVVIRDNTATATSEVGASFIHGEGGGLGVRGPLTGTRVTIFGNRAVGDGVSSRRQAYGGGLSLNAGAVTLSSSTIHHNTASATEDAFGGGVYMNGDMNLTTVWITDNVASAMFPHGGGIAAKGGTLTASALTVQGNVPNDCESLVC